MRIPEPDMRCHASVSSAVADGLEKVTNEARQYSADRRHARIALRSPGSLGSGERRTWKRDEAY